MKFNHGLLVAALSVALPALADAAVTLQIDGVPLDQIESKGLGQVSSHTTKAGTQWTVSMNGHQFQVLEGKELVADHLRAELAAESKHSGLKSKPTLQLQQALAELEQQIGTEKTTYSQARCGGTLDFTPSFARNMWYGHAFSDVTWHGAPGPTAGTVKIWAMAQATGQTGSDFGSDSYSLLNTQSVNVTAQASWGPEATSGISLWSRGGMSGACGVFWFPTVYN